TPLHLPARPIPDMAPRRAPSLRPSAGRANITEHLSHPAAARRPDDTAPSQRAAKGFVCPQCQRRFDDAAPSRGQCPDDGAPLVRVSDMAAADGDPMLGRVLAGRFTILAKLGA